MGDQSVSSRLTPSVCTSRTASSRAPHSAREPRACPLAGASKEHEQLHRRFHDDAAGERISWWLRQRDIAGGYAKTNGVLVGGPSVEGLDRRLSGESHRLPKQLTRAFADAAGQRVRREGKPRVKSKPSKSEKPEPEPAVRLVAERAERETSAKEAPPAPGLASIPERAAGCKRLGSQPRAEGTKQYPTGVCEAEDLIQQRATSDGKLQAHLGMSEFLGAAGKRSLGRPRREGLRTNVVRGVSQVDEVVFGHDMDSSAKRVEEYAGDSAWKGAAGQRYVGNQPKKEGMRHNPAKDISEADTVILGRELGHSAEKLSEHLQLEAFKDAAGSQSIGQRPRQGGLKPDLTAGVSEVDKIISGCDAGLDERLQGHMQASQFQGAAGRRYVGHREKHGGLRPSHMAHVSAVDQVAFGHAIGSNPVDAHLQSPNWAGAAGRKCIGAEAKIEGRQTVLGSGLSQVDEIVWGHDIDRSADKLRAKERARLRAMGLD